MFALAYFPTQQRKIQFGRAITRDELRFLQAEKVGKKPSRYVGTVSYQPGADFDPGGGSEFFHIAQAGFFARIEHQVAVAFRRAKVEKFIDVVHYAALAQEIESNDAATKRSHREPVGAGFAVHMVAHLPTPTAVHVLDHGGGIPRDIFAQKRNDGLDAVIADPSGRGTGDDRNGFSLVEWRLREAVIG